MKICHITSVHPRYDIRIFIKECRTLALHYATTLIVADLLGDEIKDNVYICDVGKARGGRLKRMRITTQLIYQKVVTIAPDIVHFHDPELMWVGQKLAQQGVKVIYDVHEDVPKQILNKRWLPKLLRRPLAWLVQYQERHTVRHFAGVICATEIIARRFCRYNSKTITLHNYPLRDELAQITTPWHERKPHLCYLGSISQERGILPLVDLLAISGLTLDLAGAYSNSAIQTQISHSGGASQVQYHGILNRKQVATLLSEVMVGIVTLLPTPSYIESLPIKLLEYMLAGIPVIASNFPLWEKYINDDQCGIMLDPTDSAAIAQACTYLINHPDEAYQMGERGRRAVLKHYLWEVEAPRLCDFYASLF